MGVLPDRGVASARAAAPETPVPAAPAAPGPAGPLYAIAAYGWWGLMPVYWKALASVPAPEILAHRVLWTSVFAALLLTVLRRWDEVAAVLRDRRERWLLAASGTLIGGNWLLYIWAVNRGQLLEASFGYYLNPLISVLLGVVFLAEHLWPIQVLAVAVAALGVAVLGVDLGGLPWISLVLALSFGAYGLLHKLCTARPIPALAVETTFIAPLALAFVAARGGGGLLDAEPTLGALLVGAGPATALPLLWFAGAARRLRLATLGLFQYLAPSLGFALAVFVYHEPFGRAHAIAFACIWIALAVYSGDAWRRSARDRRR